MSVATESLRRTPLYAAHLERGAKLVGFGGWEMPVQYTGILAEHNAVRQHAGLFDISHMGEVIIAGPQAETALNRLLTNDVRLLAPGQAQYTLLCNAAGGIIDDLILYRLEPAVFLLVINASHIPRDVEWIRTHAPADVLLDNISDRTAALALQGPRAVQYLPAAADLKPFHITRLTLAGKPCWVARTGYTGEDGFEIICDDPDVVTLWNHFLQAGVTPCGLGARDTLRLEMCYPLHGNDITENTTPLEAGLGKYVNFDKGDFIGRDAIERNPTRKLIAFKMTGKTPPPRPHYPIQSAGRVVGEVTSGTQSPSLGYGIGLGYVAAGTTDIAIEIRGQLFPATMEKKPLLRKNK